MKEGVSTDMNCKTVAAAGVVIGWGGAGTLIFTGETMQALLSQTFLLSVGIVSTAWLMLCARNRPMMRAFEIGRDDGFETGYRAGREHAQAELGGGRVIRLRQEGRRIVSL